METQAVFSLRGKPLNCFGLTKKVVYENEEFNLLQHALNIEEGLEGLRYNNIVIATDADVDGMHIRLLIMTFFLQFFPDLVKKDQYISWKHHYSGCAISRKRSIVMMKERNRLPLKNWESKPEITRFKGLGEISPEEFAQFIGDEICVRNRYCLSQGDHIQKLLEYYMGKNTPERQEFIIDNLKIEQDVPITEDGKRWQMPEEINNCSKPE